MNGTSKKLWKNLKRYVRIIWNGLLDILQNNMMISVLLLLYILFYCFWESLIEEYIIKKFLCFFKPSFLNDIIFVLVAAVCWHFAFKRKGSNVKRTMLLSIIAIAMWGYYRCPSHILGLDNSSYYLDLYPMYLIEPIKYFDIVLVIALGFLFSVIRKEPQKLEFKDGFIVDEPIGKPRKDDLERYRFADYYIDRLIDTDTNNEAYTLGIDSPWGAGKTSFMNLMKSYLKDQIDKYELFKRDERYGLNNRYKRYQNIIIIDFNPWLYADEKDLVSVFFGELSKSIKEYDLSLAKNLIQYSDLLSAFDTTETKIISSLIDLTHNERTLHDKKNEITDVLKRLQRRIFVFIDDLDRLDTDELMEIMKLVRNTSNFPYMYFIVAYDKSYLVQCLSKKMPTKETIFIDKIFQQEFHLPPCPTGELKRLLFDYIVASTGLDDYNNDKKLLYNYIHQNTDYNPINALSNLREVKRLANHFSVSYKYGGKGTYVIDLLLIEFIKTKYPLVFSFFESKHKAILELSLDGKYYTLYRGKDDYSHIDFINYIQGHLEDFRISIIDGLTIKTVFDQLFELIDSETTNDKKSNRISHVYGLHRYINLSELKSDITQHEFMEVLNQDVKDVEKSFKEWITSKPTSLEAKISSNRLRYMSSDKIKKIIQGLLFCISDKGAFKISSHSLFIIHIIPLIHQLKEYRELDGYRNEYDYPNYSKKNNEFVLTAFKKNGYSEGLCECISYFLRCHFEELTRDFREWKPQKESFQNDISKFKEFFFNVFPLTSKGLSELQKCLFDECIQNSADTKSVIHAFANLMGCDVDESTISVSSFDTVARVIKFYPDYASEMRKAMRDYVDKNIKKFMPFFVYFDDRPCKDASEKYQYKLSPLYKLIWSSWPVFFDFITKKCLSINELSNYKFIFDEFKKRGFNRGIPTDDYGLNPDHFIYFD